jgi:lysine-specific histone demethylase 1B
MKRRQFLRNSSIASIGSVLLSPLMLSACREKGLLKNIKYDGKVIIVGAGAAGLYAGYILKSRGIDFSILEASDIYGGRMGKLNGFADYPIDTGAQWMHGSNSIVADLVKAKKTNITLDETEIKYWYNNHIVKSLPNNPFIFEGDNLPDISFKDYAIEQGFNSDYENIIEAIAGDQGASASLLSAYWNNKDEENWVSGDEDFKFKKTYFDVIDEYIAQEVNGNIQLNTPITSINYTASKIILKDHTNNNYIADKVIITVPISILKLNEIKFTPDLPSEKTYAFSKIGMGPGIKVFLKFNNKFYEDVLYGGSVCAAYLDDTIGKNTTNNVLLAFVMGDQAAKLSALPDDVSITNVLLQELDIIYKGKATASFISSSVHNYTKKPYIKGAYGYSSIGMGNARQIAALPVNDKLYFAGEAMNTNGHHQTVHGAIETGYKAAMDIIESILK